MKKLFLPFVAILLASACVSNYGTQTVNDFSKYTELEKGVTTKLDIHDSFGQPHGILKIDETGGSIWRYASMRSTINALTYIPFVGMVAGGNNVDIASAEFFFDKNNTFEKAERSENSRYINQWLAIGDAFTTNGQVKMIEDEMLSLGLPFDEKLARADVQNLDLNE